MATRGIIAKTEKGATRAIYVHFGHPLEMGPVLLEHYAQAPRIDEMLDLGDASIIQERLYPSPSTPHRLGAGQAQKNVSVFYGRDGFGPLTEAKKAKSVGELAADTDAEYIFEFVGGAWRLHHLKYTEVGGKKISRSELLAEYIKRECTAYEERIAAYYAENA